MTRTSEPRRHIHHREDEAFYVLDGQLTFHVGDAVLTAAAGSLAFAPMGIPHTFTVDTEPSRILVITSPAGFERFVFELGVPATSDVPPAGLTMTSPAVIGADRRTLRPRVRRATHPRGRPLTMATRRRPLRLAPVHDRRRRAPLPRVEVRKTYKLYIGGQFPRTESGRSYVVKAAGGELLANACRASRKDVRDAVRAARAPSTAGPDGRR